MRKKRSELRLSTRDMVERLKSHRCVETLTERMANLKVRLAPRPEQPHHKLGAKIDVLLVARTNSKCSALDLLTSLC